MASLSNLRHFSYHYRFSILYSNYGAEQRSADKPLNQSFHFIVEAHDTASKEESHVATNVGYEAVKVVDEILLLLQAKPTQLVCSSTPACASALPRD